MVQRTRVFAIYGISLRRWSAGDVEGASGTTSLSRDYSLYLYLFSGSLRLLVDADPRESNGRTLHFVRYRSPRFPRRIRRDKNDIGGCCGKSGRRPMPLDDDGGGGGGGIPTGQKGQLAHAAIKMEIHVYGSFFLPDVSRSYRSHGSAIFVLGVACRALCPP